ncbi:MAG: hypothetical protein RJA07_1772 [Bacteroidota bacterium]
MYNIIARKTLLDYCKKYPQASTALQELYYELLNGKFKNYNELKNVYPNASIIQDNRVIFNVLSNHYRLVVRVVFEYKTIQIKWFGTHAEYDKINVATIKFKKK